MIRRNWSKKWKLKNAPQNVENLQFNNGVHRRLCKMAQLKEAKSKLRNGTHMYTVSALLWNEKRRETRRTTRCSNDGRRAFFSKSCTTSNERNKKQKQKTHEKSKTNEMGNQLENKSSRDRHTQLQLVYELLDGIYSHSAHTHTHTVHRTDARTYTHGMNTEKEK